MTTSPIQRRPLARLALVSVASLGLVGGSVAVAGPASAGGYDDRGKRVCNVDAKKVDHKENHGKYSDNRKKRDKADVKFEFKIWCDKKTNVKFEHWIFQKKPNHKWVLIKHRDGKIDNAKHEWKYTKAEVKDRGHKGGEEKVFHVVKIKFDNGKHKVTKSDHEYGKVDFGHRY